MTRDINLASKNGYVWNEASKKLESYEFISATFDLCPSTEITYLCKVGGVEQTLQTMHLKVYKDEEAFKRGEELPHEEHYVNGNVLPISGEWTYIFCNGQAERRNAEDIEITYDGKEMRTSIKCYQSPEEVYKYNDIIVKEADGTERVSKCIASILALTEEQSALVEALRDILRRLKESNAKVVVSAYCGTMRVINTSNVDYQGVVSDYDAREHEDWIGVYDMGELVSKDFDVLYNEEYEVYITRKESAE